MIKYKELKKNIKYIDGCFVFEDGIEDHEKIILGPGKMRIRWSKRKVIKCLEWFAYNWLDDVYVK